MLSEQSKSIDDELSLYLLNRLWKAANWIISEWKELSFLYQEDWGYLLGIGAFLLMFWRFRPVLKLSLICIVTASSAILLPFVLDFFLPRWNLSTFNLPPEWLSQFILNAAGSLFLSVMSFRLITKLKEWGKSRLTLGNPTEREGLTDVRDLKRFFPNTRKLYNPIRYFSNNYFFFGLDLKRRLVKLLDTQVNKQHIAVTGPTGSGKGVILQSLMAQSITKGQTTLYLDPNFDNTALRLLEQYAIRSKRPFIFIDLNGDIPQWNPWSGQSQSEIEELCAAVFGLSDNFDIADVHRLADRDASIAFAKVAANRKAKPFNFIAELLKSDASLSSEAKKFVKDLSQLADMAVINIAQGLDLLEAIQNKSVIYVRGATRNPRVLKLQRLFVLAVIHAVEKRRREELEVPPVFLVIDEYKYSCSPQSTEALATIRKSGCHMAIASQSYLDLRNCPKDMDPDSVISSVVENAAVHINYKSNDIELSDTIARSTGFIAIDEEVREIELSPIWAEKSTGNRSLRKGERPRIDTNMIMNMPKGCAVIRGNIEPQIIHICPIKVDMKRRLPKPTIFPDSENQDSRSNSISEELINVD